MRENRAVDIVYQTRKKGVITRRVDPYEIKGGKIYVANHRTSEIKSLLPHRLMEAVSAPRARFKPRWKVQG